MKNQDSAWLRPSRLAVALLGAGATLTAQAQPAADEERERTVENLLVIGRTPETVSSLKSTAPLLNTPRAVSVIPQELFNAQGAHNLTDVLRNTPGISFSAGENGFAANNNNFTMRGFDTSGNVFVDGVRDSGNYSRDVFNLEAVEVIKGPAADNGRGGAGGYVNLVTKRPQSEAFMRGMISYGFDRYGDSEERFRSAVDINQPVNDAMAVRVNVLLQDGGVAGREYAEADTRAIAPSIAFGLGTETQFTLAAQYVEQDNVPDWGVPAAMIEGMMRFDPAAARADRESFYGLASDSDETESKSLTGRFEHDLRPGLSIINQTRWTQTDRDAAYTLPTGYDVDTQNVSTQRQFYDRETRTLSNLTGINGSFRSGRVAHTISAGLELTREESSALRFGTDSSPGQVSVFAPDPFRPVEPAPTASQSSGVDIDTVALYLYDTIELNARWQITGGLRGERFDVTIDSTDLVTGLPQGPDGYAFDDTTVSGNVGVVFKPASNGSVYIATSLSSLPPGSYLSNPDISRTGDNAFPGLAGHNNMGGKVQRAVNLELGTKWSVADGRFAATGAVFKTERRNVGISGKTPGDPDSPTVLQGYGKQIVEGIEIGFSGALTDAWSLFAGLLLMDSERKHSAFLDAARREANPNDYGDVLRTDGDQLAFTPRRTGNLWTTYRFPFGLTLGAGVQYFGDSYAGRPDDADRIIPNGTFGKLPSYTTYSMLLSYAATDSWSVRLNVDNMTDELYATSTNWPAQRVFLGPPRSYIVSADFRF